MTAYYNEHDPFAADWLRNLITEGAIAPGDVDTRSIADVTSADLMGYTQCHFFAGIGVWSRALRSAGWPDDVEVWTGSCPCQPFSVSGKGAGIADDRHLWPEFHRLIEECSPHVVFGEQVASPAGLSWLDIVSTDLERTGYAVGAVDTCAAGFGAPHIRQRLYFVADSGQQQYRRRDALGDADRQLGGSPSSLQGGRGSRPMQAWVWSVDDVADGGAVRDGAGVVGDAVGAGLQRHSGDGNGPAGRPQSSRPAPEASSSGILADFASDRGSGDVNEPGLELWGESPEDDASDGRGTAAGPVNGFWRVSEWIPCRDGKQRPIEPGTFPLAHGLAADMGCVLPGQTSPRGGEAPWRKGMIHGYGNALVSEQAKGFIVAYLEVLND